MKNAHQRFVYRFSLLLGLICLTATFAHLLPGAERIVVATQQAVSSPGSLISKARIAAKAGRRLVHCLMSTQLPRTRLSPGRSMRAAPSASTKASTVALPGL